MAPIRMRVCLQLLGLCLIGFLFWTYFVEQHARTYMTAKAKDSRFRILLWDRKLPYWGDGHSKKCKTKCVFIRERDQIKYSNAVIFSGRFVKTEPPKRENNQIWVFYSQEAPPRFVQDWNRQIPLDQYAFNITSTYSVHADLPIPQRTFHCKKHYNDRVDRSTDYTQGKNLMIAWFVSHCKTHSRREKFVHELAKYIPVDIYGRCSRLSCPRSEEEHCWAMLNSSYMFYLAFENSICQEYATEKVWNIYQRNINIVPVVMGGANYSRILPKNTYINVADFVGGDMSKSARNLADFLKRISKDKSKYNKYIIAKKRYFFENKSYEYFCELCNYLTCKTPGQSFIPKDITQFWMGQEAVDKHCVSPKDYHNPVVVSCPPRKRRREQESSPGSTPVLGDITNTQYLAADIPCSSTVDLPPITPQYKVVSCPPRKRLCLRYVQGNLDPVQPAHVQELAVEHPPSTPQSEEIFQAVSQPGATDTILVASKHSYCLQTLEDPYTKMEKMKAILEEQSQKLASMQHRATAAEEEVKALKSKRLTREKLKDDPSAVQFYTGFPNYAALFAFCSVIEPKVHALKHWRGPSTSKDSAEYQTTHKTKPGPKRQLTALSLS